MGAVEQQEL